MARYFLFSPIDLYINRSRLIIYPFLPGKISKGMIVIKLTKFHLFRSFKRDICKHDAFLYMTHCLDLVYMPAKYMYNQNFSEGIKAMERKSFC